MGEEVERQAEKRDNQIAHATRYMRMVYQDGDEYSMRVALEYLKEFDREWLRLNGKAGRISPYWGQPMGKVKPSSVEG